MKYIIQARVNDLEAQALRTNRQALAELMVQLTIAASLNEKILRPAAVAVEIRNDHTNELVT